MDFQKDVIQKSKAKAVIVDFYADWCGPCKMIKPFLNKAVEERDDVDLVMINIDHHQQIAQQFGVRSVPHILMFQKGVPVSKLPKGVRIPVWIDQVLSEKPL